MTVSKAQQRAKNKYDKEHYSIIGCKVKTETAEAFKQYAATNNTTVNALLSGFVSDCLADYAHDTPANTTK